MRNLLFIRSKMGTEIRCYKVTGGYSLEHGGKSVHVTGESIEASEVAQDAAFFAAWSNVTGFEPFSVIRKTRGGFRKVGTCFIPAGHKVTGIKAGWKRCGVKFEKAA